MTIREIIKGKTIREMISGLYDPIYIHKSFRVPLRPLYRGSTVSLISQVISEIRVWNDKSWEAANEANETA